MWKWDTGVNWNCSGQTGTYGHPVYVQIQISFVIYSKLFLYISYFLISKIFKNISLLSIMYLRKLCSLLFVFFK